MVLETILMLYYVFTVSLCDVNFSSEQLYDAATSQWTDAFYGDQMYQESVDPWFDWEII